MIITSRIDNSIIDINFIENKNYGIMLSGGLDSSVLLGLILHAAAEENKKIVLQPFSMIKHDNSYSYVPSILNCLEKKFHVNLPDTILIGNPEIHHSQQSKYATLEIFSKYPDIDFIFNGVNQNPPPPWGEETFLFPNRVKRSPHKKILMPFVELTKVHILDLLYQFNLEELINLTHSCTEKPSGRCNLCFQCNERRWAFEQLGVNDTGSL
jgi:hypothetical protein